LATIEPGIVGVYPICQKIRLTSEAVQLQEGSSGSTLRSSPAEGTGGLGRLLAALDAHTQGGLGDLMQAIQALGAKLPKD
jgi:uncharacterized protein YidB (DUF937 family)